MIGGILMSWSSRGSQKAVTVILLVAIAACTDSQGDSLDLPTGVEREMSAVGPAPAPPSDLVPVSFGSESAEIFPWLGKDFAGSISDPVNLIFVGKVDVLSLRAALMSLDGDRTALGFPAGYPFDCTWTDASGDMLTAYSEDGGWVSNPVQLQCGSYDPLRFHIRFFEAGDWVLGGVHLDFLIPNTPYHQVLSWELPEQLILADFQRSGLLDQSAPFSLAPLTAPGGVQEIPAGLYNEIPDDLKTLAGLAPGPTTAPVPVMSDGQATILNLAARAPVVAGETHSDFVVPFDMVAPKPFCPESESDYVLLQGPLHLTTRTRVNSQGMLESHNTLRGELEVTPIDMMTSLPSGRSFRALISGIDNTGVGPNGSHVSARLQQMALPPGTGQQTMHLVTGPNGLAYLRFRERCGG
jgi:hypothetical protein